MTRVINLSNSKMSKLQLTLLLIIYMTFESSFGLNLRTLRRNKTEIFHPKYRIVRGWMTSILRRPFMVSLQKSTTIARATCGGSIVSDRWILTAAHCVINDDKIKHPSEMIVVAGFTNIRRISRIEYIYKIHGLYAHPQYNGTRVWNDIALVKIKGKFNIGNSSVFTRAVDLMDPKVIQGRPVEQVYKNCVALGWGTVAWKGRYSDILKEVKLPLINHWLCARMLGGGINLRPTNVCTFDDTEHGDACHGDSGGPLMCYDENDNFVQVGIVSWGRGCGKFKTPGVWTRVDGYRKWIDKVVGGDTEIAAAANVARENKNHNQIYFLTLQTTFLFSNFCFGKYIVI